MATSVVEPLIYRAARLYVRSLAVTVPVGIVAGVAAGGYATAAHGSPDPSAYFLASMFGAYAGAAVGVAYPLLPAVAMGAYAARYRRVA